MLSFCSLANVLQKIIIGIVIVIGKEIVRRVSWIRWIRLVRQARGVWQVSLVRQVRNERQVRQILSLKIMHLNIDTVCSWRLMGSQIMISIGYWNQMCPDWKVTNYTFIPKVRLSQFAYCYQSFIVIKLAWPMRLY